MNINKIKIGDKVKTVNDLVEYYIVENKLKSVVWLRLPDNVSDFGGDRIFKGINPSIIKKVI